MARFAGRTEEGRARIMISNKRTLNTVANSMKTLASMGENSVFVSQYRGNDKEHATAIMCLTKDEESPYLACRRLLQALQYRLKEDTNLRLEFRITQKKGGK